MMAITLDSIRKNTRKAPRILLYGPEKMGKTTFACCAHPNGPARAGVVVIQTEDGLGDIEVPAFPKATKFTEVLDALSVLYHEEHEFNTVVVDSLDWLEPLVWTYTCAQNEWESIESAGYGKGYIAADVSWRLFFDWLNALRDHRGMTVILIAHQQTVRVEDPELPAYDQATIKLHKRACALAGEYTDVILRASVKTLLTSDPSASPDAKKKGNARQISATTGQRVISCQPKPGALAGNRYNLPAELPLDWSVFEAAMAASRRPQTVNEPATQQTEE